MRTGDQQIPDDLKLKLLQNCWTPTPTYDFKSAKIGSGNRSFQYKWLVQYAPWLAYSHSQPGALCRYCVLFSQKVTRGLQGAFIVNPLTNYKDFHGAATRHANCAWHKASQCDATNFIATMTRKCTLVDQQLHTEQSRIVDENRKKLYPIVSSIVYCGTHDIPLRGKTSSSGNLHDLLDFRVEAGDTVLKNHLLTASGNAKYTSVRVQNEIIDTCATLLREDIVHTANASNGFSILADETTDISGTEQMSLGVRFVENSCGKLCIKEEFLGFVPIMDRSAAGMADVILKACSDFGLNLDKLVGQGYDGCSAMAGKEGGVQAFVKAKYPRATFVHCSSHRLNLVVNDLNKLNDVRNGIGTVKSIINFFRESAQRRRLVPNVPVLCETRWTHKYRSIRLFADSFPQIVTQLENLSQSDNKKTRETAYQLLCAARTPSFLVVLTIIKKYSAMLEPITQALQAVHVDLLQVQSLIEELLVIFQASRQNGDEEYKSLYTETERLATQIDVEMTSPRHAVRQTNRANPPSTSTEEFYRRSLFVPYLDSLISSLTNRFAPDNKTSYSLLSLHPYQMAKLSKDQFLSQIKHVGEFYNLDNFDIESSMWYEVWLNRRRQNSDIVEMHLIDVLEYTQLFPSIRSAILTALALPATTCTIERSFSTLRQVKTWLRSTMSDDRLSGLCMMSVHRKMFETDPFKNVFINRVIDKFGQERRRLEFLFRE